MTDLDHGPLPDASDQERIGRAALELIDHIHEEIPGGELDVVCIVAAVRFTDSDGDGSHAVTYWCEDERKWATAGLLNEAAASALARPED